MLLDLNLPDASGIGALERISKSDPSIPIVVLTGLNDEHFGISAVASGAQDYLVKGRVEPETLRRSLLYAIERKRAELTAVELHASRIRAGENARLERGLQPSPLLLDDPGVDIITRYRASRAYALLGGDFYDVVQTPDRTVHVMIGDVAGHGPDEAALGVALRIGWRALTFAGLRGNERMRQLERILFAERPAKGIFATLLSLAFAPDSLRFTAVRAGHPGMLVHGNDDVQWLEPPAGPALGLGAHEWPVTELELPEGHGLVLLTDGLFEGHSGRGNERLGEDGLLELARSLAGLPGGAFVDALIDEVEARARTHGGLTDDIAVVRVERTTTMTAPRRGRGLTVQGWQNLVLAVMGVVVLTGAIAGAILLNRTDAVSSELIDNIQPARVAAYQLQAALRDQETALRGTRSPPTGNSSSRTSTGNAPNDPRPTKSAVGWATAVTQSMTWTRSNEQLPAGGRRTPTRSSPASRRGAPTWWTTRPPSAARPNSTVSERYSMCRTSICQRRGKPASTNSTACAHWRDRVLVALIVAFFAMAILLAVLVRSAVTRPLAAFAAACRRITEGNFGRTHHSAAAPETFAPSRSTSRTCGSASSTNSEATRSAQASLDEQAAELRRSNAELEQFAYVASHDLQEPLRKVASFCQLLEKRYGDKLDERGTEYIGFAVDGAKRMQVLINDLLTFSRVGRLNATDDRRRPRRRAGHRAGQPVHRDRGVGRRDHPAGGRLPQVDGDPTLLTMVWQNLIGNAVKFRREGVAPRIVIECEPTHPR